MSASLQITKRNILKRGLDKFPRTFVLVHTRDRRSSCKAHATAWALKDKLERLSTVLIRTEIDMEQAYEDFQLNSRERLQERKNAGGQGSDSFSFSIWLVEKFAQVS